MEVLAEKLPLNKKGQGSRFLTDCLVPSKINPKMKLMEMLILTIGLAKLSIHAVPQLSAVISQARINVDE